MDADKRTRVFIIDDNELVRMLLRTMIHGDLYNDIGEAATAEAALARLPALLPDLVRLDVMLPDSYGLALLKQIRLLLPECVLLMITSCNERSTVETAMRDGAKGFIIKPFSQGLVLDTMKHALGQRGKAGPTRAMQG